MPATKKVSSIGRSSAAQPGALVRRNLTREISRHRVLPVRLDSRSSAAPARSAPGWASVPADGYRATRLPLPRGLPGGREPHLLAPFVESGGFLPRKSTLDPLDSLDKEHHRVGCFGLTIGALNIYHAKLLKPGAIRWRRHLAGGGCPCRRRMHRSLPNPKARRSQHGAWQGFAALPGKCCGSTWPNGSPALPMMRATAENLSRRIPHSPRRSGSAMRRSPGSCRRWAFKPSRRPPTMRPPDWLGCRAPKACKPAQGNAFAKLAELDLRRG